MTLGRSATSRRGDTCTCGQMGSTCRPEWKRTAECMLVLVGATPEGKKELVGFQTGVREGAQSWRELLIDIKQRGLEIAPRLAVATARSASGRRSRRSFRAPGTALLGSQDR